MRADQAPKAPHFVPSFMQAGGQGSGYGKAQAEFGQQFFNGLAVPVTVVMRSGMRLVIQPIRNMRVKTFVIRSFIGVGVQVNVDTHGLLDDEGQTTSKEAKLLDSVYYVDSLQINRLGIPTANVDYWVNYLELQQNGGSLYLRNLDIVLSTAKDSEVPLHPFSLPFDRQAMVEAEPLLNTGLGLSYQIRIVDRNNRFGSRYVNLNGEVFHLPVDATSEFLDGVYLVTTYPTLGDAVSPTPRSEYHSFESAEAKLRLYRTFNEALTLGNPEDVYKRELEDRKRALSTEEARMKLQKLERDQEWEDKRRIMEMDRAQREEAMRIREHEYAIREHQLKRDALVLKDLIDDRSHGRREIVEILKHIPALVSGGWALWLAIKKIKSL